MARITVTGYSNFHTTLEPALFDRQGKERLPGEKPNLSHLVQAREEEPSAGTSSSTSESKQEPNGSSALETDPSTQSPALCAESPSEPDPQASLAQSSTASSTDGSTPETGRGRRRQQASSVASAAATPVTPDITDDDPEEGLATDGIEALHMARQAYDDGEYDLAEEMLKEAEKADPSLVPEIVEARRQIDAAVTAQKSGQ